TVSIPSVDETKAWLLFTYLAENESLPDIAKLMVRGVVMNPTNLIFDRNLTFEAMTLTWYLVVFTDTTSVQSSRTFLATGVTQRDTAIACVDPSKTIVTAGGMYHRGGSTAYSTDDNPGAGTVMLDLTTSTNLRVTRGASQNGADRWWFAVECGTGCNAAGTFPTDTEREAGLYIPSGGSNTAQLTRQRTRTAGATPHWPN